MDTKTLERELLDLENEYWQAMKNKDMAAASRLTDFPCIVVGPQGVGRLDENAFAGMLKASSWTLQEFKLEDGAQIRLLSDDVAIAAYRVHQELVVEGTPTTVDAADCSVWVRRGGRWLCALHTESLSGDPYGRHRGRIRS